MGTKSTSRSGGSKRSILASYTKASPVKIIRADGSTSVERAMTPFELAAARNGKNVHTPPPKENRRRRSAT